MYSNPDLSEDPIDYEVFKQILSDNGYSKTDQKIDLEMWTDQSGNELSFPRQENKVPSDFVLHALKKAGISEMQIELYRDLIFNK